jgi:predicted GH43/DUF377 family glycosyl hydrolase
MMKIQFLFAISLLCFEIHADLIPEEEFKYSDYSDYSDYFFSVQEDENFPLDQLIDMNTMTRDFILETKKIELPEYPDAFNPSIIKWRGSLLMSFRVYNQKNRSTNPFALVWLNENFEPISVPQVFELPFYNPILPSKQQDPRLISVGERLFVVYNNVLENITNREMRRMFFAELFYDGEKFIASEPECFVDFEGKNEMRYEKNWVPFEYNGELLLVYSIIPHRLLRPMFGTGTCKTVATTLGNIQWNWGVPRGGTQAVLDGDHYLAFFHSWIDLPTIQSNGRKVSHYVMGAYMFEAHPPFSIIAISPEPIVAENFYQPPYYKTWKPLRCIFPAGLVINEDYIWVSYGRQDHEIWIAKLDKKNLLKSLTPVSAK